MTQEQHPLHRVIFTRDNLEILRGLDTGLADLIYLDPPFNSDSNYGGVFGLPGQPKKRVKKVFGDVWKLNRKEDLPRLEMYKRSHPALYHILYGAWLAKGDKSLAYLLFMAPRLIEMKRVLKSTGSIFLHCDPTESHSLKLMLDIIFGHQQYRNEIVWAYTRMGAKGQRQYSRAHDIILWYSASQTWTFNVDEVRLPYADTSKSRQGYKLTKLGSGIPAEGVTKLNPIGKFPEDWWTHIPYLRSKRERVGYPTQKPVALLERIIKASTHPGDVVLDPFCGCATACVAAERLNRQWIGIDLLPLSHELMEYRLKEHIYTGGDLLPNIPKPRTAIPRRPHDLGTLSPPSRHKPALYGEQAGKCNGCCRGPNERFTKQDFEIDHIIPKSRGGTDHKDNLQLLCGRCNRLKSDNEMAHLVAQLEATGELCGGCGPDCRRP